MVKDEDGCLSTWAKPVRSGGKGSEGGDRAGWRRSVLLMRGRDNNKGEEEEDQRRGWKMGRGRCSGVRWSCKEKKEGESF